MFLCSVVSFKKREHKSLISDWGSDLIRWWYWCVKGLVQNQITDAIIKHVLINNNSPITLSISFSFWVKTSARFSKNILPTFNLVLFLWSLPQQQILHLALEPSIPPIYSMFRGSILCSKFNMEIGLFVGKQAWKSGNLVIKKYSMVFHFF